MHATEQVDIDLSSAIMRMRNARNQLDTTGYSWASNALTATIRALQQIERENPQPSRDKITYTNVIGDLCVDKKMWSIGHTEVPEVGEFQFYVSAEGYIVYWFIDSSTSVSVGSQLDFALAALNQCEYETLKQLETVAGHLERAVA